MENRYQIRFDTMTNTISIENNYNGTEVLFYVDEAEEWARRNISLRYTDDEVVDGVLHKGTVEKIGTLVDFVRNDWLTQRQIKDLMFAML